MEISGNRQITVTCAKREICVSYHTIWGHTNVPGSSNQMVNSGTETKQVNKLVTVNRARFNK